jgi:aminopeptidase N
VLRNWGLVTYRETALLIDAKSSGVASKQRVAYVVAHELAHQWFGNIVTMDWWKELWLNEGFATFVGNQAINHLFPEWDIWTQFASQYFNGALHLDGLENSHPIEVEVYKSGEINEIFDAISYNKGASVIRMVATVIGEAAFKKGLNIYLNRHKYKNAVTEDLWNALAESSGFPVKDFMDNWTKTTGYPLVTIESVGKDQFKIKQSRFFSNGKVQSGSDAQKWWVHITVEGENMKPFVFDLKDFEATVTVPGASNAGWLKINGGQSGFFRTRYSGT